MQHFYVLRAKHWKRWTVVVVFAFFTAVFLWSGQEIYPTFSSAGQEVVLTKGDKNESNIGLTFNISWGEEKVHNILAQLEKHKVQATFFVSGEWAELHPEILEEITEQKHELGMLGHRYKSYLDQEIEEVRKDLIKGKETFEKLGYEDVDLLRAPNGHLNKDIVELAENQGFNIIHWNVNPNDWENPGTDMIIDYVMKETSNGDIILLHASDSAKHTAESLKTILPGLKNKGYKFVSISELLNQAHAKSKTIE